MQRVLTSPLGSGLRLEERASRTRVAPGRPGGLDHAARRQRRRRARARRRRRGCRARTAHLCRRDATLNGAPAPPTGGGNPLSQGVAGPGPTSGPIPAGATVTIAYAARAARAVPMSARCGYRRAISTPREPRTPCARTRPSLVPARAAARQDRSDSGRRRRRRPSHSSTSHRARCGRCGAATTGTVRVFAFDRRYRDHHPVDPHPRRRRSARAQRCSAPRRRGGSDPPRRQSRAAPVRRAAAVSLPVSGVADLARGHAALLQPQARASSRLSCTCRTRSS